jgi:hypothetical protein
MDTAKTTDLAARVCPRCGDEAGEQRFCGGCGLNLSEQHELPTRSEWETAHATSDQATPGQPSPDAGHQESDSPATKARSGLDRQLRDARRWYDRQSKQGKVAFLISTTVAVILVAAVIIGAASGGKSSGGENAQRAVNALSKLFHERYSSVEDGTCESFGGGDDFFTCQFKIEGEWHTAVSATIHPDGSISWEDNSGRVSQEGTIN